MWSAIKLIIWLITSVPSLIKAVRELIGMFSKKCVNGVCKVIGK